MIPFQWDKEKITYETNNPALAEVQTYKITAT